MMKETLATDRSDTTSALLADLNSGVAAWISYQRRETDSTDVSTPVPGYLKQSADLIDAVRTGSASGTCVDHIVVLGEAHLRQTLREYARYYNTARTHRSLDQDALVFRHV